MYFTTYYSTVRNTLGGATQWQKCIPPRFVDLYSLFFFFSFQHIISGRQGRWLIKLTTVLDSRSVIGECHDIIQHNINAQLPRMIWLVQGATTTIFWGKKWKCVYLFPCCNNFSGSLSLEYMIIVIHSNWFHCSTSCKMESIHSIMQDRQFTMCFNYQQETDTIIAEILSPARRRAIILEY
jgi:hypothetical protein